MSARITIALLAWSAACAQACSGGGPAALQSLPLRWIETTMSDGKPLVLTLTRGERDGTLVIRFEKTAEGLWAEGVGELCEGTSGLEVRLARDKLALGPAAPWLLRIGLGDGGTFGLKREPSGALAVSTTGWSGRFRPEPLPSSRPSSPAAAQPQGADFRR